MIHRLAVPLILFAFAVAPASATGNQYRAELAKPASTGHFVVHDLVWNCEGESCAAIQTTSRPATDCAALADKAGALRSFSVAGQKLASDALEKCNARAR